MRRNLVFAWLALSLAGFASPPPDASLSWGHLPPTWRLVPGERQFLINWPKGRPYRVCLGRAVAGRSPGLEEEIDAAVNVWARELGREIDVRFVERDVPQPRATSRKEDVRLALAARCRDADLGFAFAPLAAQSLGETGFKRTDVVTQTSRGTETKRTETGERYLFLRDLAGSPVPVELGGVRLAWAAFGDVVPAAAGLQGKALRDAILERYAARDTVNYVFDGKLPRIAVLVHELGHVWGLCDLYESDQLCDPRHSGRVRLPPGKTAVMGPVLYRQPLFLADDDLAGLRALAQRPGFDAWHARGPEPKPVRLPDVELFRAKVSKRTDTHIVVDGHLLTNRPARLAVELRQPDAAEWQTVDRLPEAGAAPRPLVEPDLRYDLRMDGGTAGVEVRLRLEVQKADGRWGEPTVLLVR